MTIRFCGWLLAVALLFGCESSQPAGADSSEAQLGHAQLEAKQIAERLKQKLLWLRKHPKPKPPKPCHGRHCPPPHDGGMPDGGAHDGGMPTDAGTTDAGTPSDAGTTDAGSPDAGPHSCAVPSSAPPPFTSFSTVNNWPGIGLLASLSPTGRDPVGPFAGDGFGASTVRTDAENVLFSRLDNGRIAAVNPYRGFLIIDASDPASPHVSAELPAIGAPSNILGRVGDTLVVGGIDVESAISSVFAVDVADPDHPQISARYALPGRFVNTDPFTGDSTWHGISTQSDGSSLVLYALTYLQTPDPATGTSVPDIRVQSLRISGGTVEAISEVVLAPSEALVAVRAAPASLVAITQTPEGVQTLRAVVTGGMDGSLTLGGEVPLTGYSNPTDMDVQAGIVRVVASVTDLDGLATEHVQTFDARAPLALQAVGDCLVPGVYLQASPRFLPDRLLFNAYIEADPFFAYEAVSVDGEGQCAAILDYGSPSLPDAFQIMNAGTRMLSTELSSDGFTRVVRLSDISSDAHALQQLAEVELPALPLSLPYQFWFDAIDGAAAATAPDGTPETGLLVISWYEQRDPSLAPGVRLLTYSDHTLTLRGEVDGVSSERAFEADGTIAALSSRRYGAIDATDPDAPSLLGSTQVAPYEYRLFAYGDYYARVRNPLREQLGTPNPVFEAATAQVEIVPNDQDPHLGAAVASFEVPAAGSLYQVGSLLVSLTSSVQFAAPELSASVVVYDLSDPTLPVQRGSLIAPELVSFQPYSDQLVLCTRARCAPRSWTSAFSLDGALVLVEGSASTNVPVMHVVDLRDPDAPAIAPPLPLSCGGFSVRTFAQGHSVYHVMMRTIAPTATDTRGRAAYYLTQLDVSDPAHPVLSDDVNVPGLPFGTDGEHVYSVEYVLGADPAATSIEQRVNAFTIDGTTVTQTASRTLEGIAISGISRAPSGQLVIGHWPAVAAGDVHGDVVTLDPSDLSERGRAPGVLWWPRPRCIESDLLVLEDWSHLHVVDTAALGTLPTSDVYAGAAQWRFVFDSRNLACGNDAVLWAHGRYGAGRIEHP